MYKIVGKLLDGRKVVGYALSDGNEVKNLPLKDVFNIAKDGKIANVKYLASRNSISGVNGFELRKLPSKQLNAASKRGGTTNTVKPVKKVEKKSKYYIENGSLYSREVGMITPLKYSSHLIVDDKYVVCYTGNVETYGSNEVTEFEMCVYAIEKDEFVYHKNIGYLKYTIANIVSAVTHSNVDGYKVNLVTIPRSGIGGYRGFMVNTLDLKTFELKTKCIPSNIRYIVKDCESDFHIKHFWVDRRYIVFIGVNVYSTLNYRTPAISFDTVLIYDTVEDKVFEFGYRDLPNIELEGYRLGYTIDRLKDNFSYPSNIDFKCSISYDAGNMIFGLNVVTNSKAAISNPDTDRLLKGQKIKIFKDGRGAMLLNK